MRRLMTGIRYEKCVVRRFRRCANVYLHKPRQYSIAYYTSMLYGKKKGKGRFMGLFNTADVRPIVFLPQTSSRIHIQRRHASYRCARPLLAKAGTITNEFC